MNREQYLTKMQKLREDLQSYEKIIKAAHNYGEKTMFCDTMKKLWKRGVQVVIKRVNTPEKYPTAYVFVKGDKGPNKRDGWFHYFTFVMLKGKEGSSILTSDREGTIKIFKSHAISRFISRHGWNGDRESCENYIMLHTLVACLDIDPYTNEINEYFADGMFLGCVKDGIQYINTYIDDSIMHRNQKIKEKWLKLRLNEAKITEAQRGDAVLGQIVKKIDSLTNEDQWKHIRK